MNPMLFTPGPMELIILMLMGGFGAPMGVPPAPEDPLMVKVAPQECVFYTTWAGTTEPDPNSTNQTEQLLAEPEVRRFFAELGEVFSKRFSGQPDRPNAGPQQAIFKDVLPLLKGLATRPGTVFISQAEMTHTGPDVRAGALICLEDDAARVQQVLEKYQQAFLGDKVESIKIGELSGYRIALPRGAPAVTWTIKGRYLIVGVGQDALEGILERARTDPPQWLTDIRDKLTIARPAGFTYINVKPIREKLLPLAGPQAVTLLRAAGLEQVAYLAGTTGLDEEGFAGRSMIGLEGEPKGLVSLLAGKPLAADDLKPIPADATVALVLRADTDQILETFLSIVAEAEPREADEVRKSIGQMEEVLGFSLRDDLLKPLGDVWCAYNSPGEGGLIVTGLTIVAQVDDHARLADSHAKLLGFFRGVLESESRGRRGQGPRIEEFEFAGQRVYVFNARDKEFPLAPAWCLTDKELIVATMPQNVKAYLSRTENHRSLATVPAVGRVIESGGAVCVSYVDTPKLFELIYPLVPMFGQSISAQLARQGIDVSVSMLPSAGSIGPHLRPGVTAVRRTASGIELINRQTVPGGNIGVALPVAVGVLLPAVSSARGAARRVQSMNNLKQIGLAMHMYHDSHKAFPPAYTADKEGKPLLSWRVLILPYLEGRVLYEQFHLDEPWDSPHNKTLIPKMPPLFKSPNGKAGPGKTNYLTVRGEGTIFSGSKGARFRDIPDGTQKTIMTVEANDQSAVTWTKPDDFQYDPKNPTKGLLGLRPGGFIAGFADGSVRFISGTIDPDTLKAAFTRAGGEIVSHYEFNPHIRPSRRRPPAPERPLTPAQAVPVK